MLFGNIAVLTDGDVGAVFAQVVLPYSSKLVLAVVTLERLGLCNYMSVRISLGGQARERKKNAMNFI